MVSDDLGFFCRTLGLVLGIGFDLASGSGNQRCSIASCLPGLSVESEVNVQ